MRKLAFGIPLIFLWIIMSGCTQQSTDKNPFLSSYQTPRQTAPFGEIKYEHYLPALEFGIAQAKEEVAAISDNSEAPTFENTIVALESVGEIVSKVSSVLYNLLGAETSTELQKIAQKASPMLTEYENDISLNEKLFKRVKAVYQQKDQLNLSVEQMQLLESSYKGFVRSGANLNEQDKEKYRAISKELSKLSLDFDEHVLNETNAFSLQITDEKDLAGLPESVREAAQGKAKEEGKEGWVIDLTMPSYLPFMKYADNRTLREKLYRAYTTKGVKDNENDNRPIVKRIVELRLEEAKLLGYNTYADFVLERRMAENSENVYKLLDKLLGASMSVAQEEYKEIQEFANKLGADFKVMPWDWGYYSEKLKKEKFDLTDEMLKPYFELEHVKKGVFSLANQLYGITFKENKEIPVYSPEVAAYEVFDKDGSFLSVYYADFHPRPGKQGGAWMNNYREQKMVNGKDLRPHVTNVCNFTRPTETKPALLTFNEVTTFLHEFGHGLHGMLARSTYSSLSGTNVYRDFVELPSQLMENFALEREFLDQFAVHYKTGEKIPAELIEKIKATANFHSGYASVRQLSFGYLDMAWHTITAPVEGSVRDFELKAWEKTQLFPPVDGSCMTTAFGHLFAGGYAAGYYGYKWAEVLDADAFSVFQKNGIFDQATAESFRKNILERGGTEHPMVLYKRFRGQEPTTEALLVRSGLKKN